MPPPPSRHGPAEAADALAAVAPLATRWIERLLAGHSPPLTVSQYLALRAIAHEDVSGAELARRAGVSGPAVSQLLAGLSAQGLIGRHALADDRRRQAIELTAAGGAALRSAAALLRERLAALLAGLPGPEVDALTRLLGAVEAALAGTAPPRRPPHPLPPGPPGPGPPQPRPPRPRPPQPRPPQPRPPGPPARAR